MVCTEDPKRSIGLWHSVMLAAYMGIHVVFVPPSVMTTLPTAWLHMVNKHKASCVISSSRALSGCISLANHKELKDLKLDGVRMLLLDDGANPCMCVSEHVQIYTGSCGLVFVKSGKKITLESSRIFW